MKANGGRISVSGTVIAGCLGVLLSISAREGAAGVNDSLVFDLALEAPAEGAPVAAANFYNRLTHSATVRQTASYVSTFTGSTELCGEPEPIRIETQGVSIPAYGNITNNEPVLILPQSTCEPGDGNAYCFRQGVIFDDMPVSSNMTVYARMYCDASCYADMYNGLQSRMFDMSYDSGNDVRTSPYGCYFYLASNKSYGFSWLNMYYGYYKGTSFGCYVKLNESQHGHWFDVVYVIRTDATALRTYVTCYARVDGAAFDRQANGGAVPPETEEIELTEFNETFGTVLKFNGRQICIGGPLANVKSGGWELLSAYKNRLTFRGGISRFRIYDRPLSRAEVQGVLTEALGGAVVAGVANGRADEFGTEDEGAAVFNPYTMSSEKMRGRLTAAHPSLTLDIPSKGSNDGLCKTVEILPVLDALAGGSATVDIAVNGEKLGSMNLSNPADCVFYVRKDKAMTNANGCVRYTITRTGNVAGALGIDAIEIAGGWGEGLHHQGASDPTGVWAGESSPQNYTLVGHPCASKYLDGTVFGPSCDNGSMKKLQATSLSFYVPESVAEKCKSSYVFGYRGSDRSGDGYPVLDLYLNGRKIDSIGSLVSYRAYTNVFAEGVLNSGYNTLVISNATPYAVVEGKGLGYYPTILFDYHRFLVKPPKGGLMMIVR